MQSLHNHRLSCGAMLLGESMPEIESAALAIFTPSGAIHDPPHGCGVAAVAGELMFRGAGDRSGRKLIDDLEDLGAHWSQSVSTSHSLFSGAMLAKHLPAVLPIYADIIRRPELPFGQFDQVRDMILHELRASEDAPAHRLFTALRSSYYPDPWGRPAEGISKEVESLSIDDIRQHVARHVQPTGTLIAVAGRIDWPQVVDQMESLFADWHSTKATSPSETGRRGATSGHIYHESQQTHMGLMWAAPPYSNEHSYEASAAIAILGGGMSSRLFLEVRERRGLCYSVSAGYQTHRTMGAAVCYSGTSAARSQETLDVILAEIQRLPQGIQQEELDRVKARATSSLVMQQESVGSRAASMARQWYHLERVMPLEEELARINRISCASIESWLSLNPPTDLTVFSLGEKALEVPSAVSA